MKVIQFALDINYSNAFLAWNETTRDAFLVDCGQFNPEIPALVRRENLTLRFILVTHSHYDHIDGLAECKKAFQVPSYAFFKSADRRIAEGDVIPFDDDAISVFETPGHIADGVSYYVNKAVFVGDAIFAGAVGGTSSRANFEEEITHVKNKILSLPDDTVIYPGHGAPSLVAVERIYNPFFT